MSNTDVRHKRNAIGRMTIVQPNWNQMEYEWNTFKHLCWGQRRHHLCWHSLLLGRLHSSVDQNVELARRFLRCRLSLARTTETLLETHLDRPESPYWCPLVCTPPSAPLWNLVRADAVVTNHMLQRTHPKRCNLIDWKYIWKVEYTPAAAVLLFSALKNRKKTRPIHQMQKKIKQTGKMLIHHIFTCSVWSNFFWWIGDGQSNV